VRRILFGLSVAQRNPGRVWVFGVLRLVCEGFCDWFARVSATGLRGWGCAMREIWTRNPRTPASQIEETRPRDACLSAGSSGRCHLAAQDRLGARGNGRNGRGYLQLNAADPTTARTYHLR
jgi:hypothetical protein